MNTSPLLLALLALAGPAAAQCPTVATPAVFGITATTTGIGGYFTLPQASFYTVTATPANGD